MNEEKPPEPCKVCNHPKQRHLYGLGPCVYRERLEGGAAFSMCHCPAYIDPEAPENQ